MKNKENIKILAGTLTTTVILNLYADSAKALPDYESSEDLMATFLQAGNSDNSTNPYNNEYDSEVTTHDDIRLVNVNSESYQGFNTLEEYDRQISAHSVEDNYQNNKHLVLQREFVNRVGYDNIQTAVADNEKVKVALDWLLTDTDALQLFIEAGHLYNGSSTKTLTALGDLYDEFKSELSDTGDGYSYKKMLIATAVAYCKDIRTFATQYSGVSVSSDPVVKFREFKKIYDNNGFLYKDQFDNFCMELVRYVMDARMDDEEIQWLRSYAEYKYPDNLSKRLNGYGFVSYNKGNYLNPDLYSEEYREKWEEKYKLSEFGLTSYGIEKRYRLWMFMEEGGICWGISGMGTNLNEVHGIPAVNMYQPGHEAYLLYSQDANGNGLWNIWNNVGNWNNSYTRWGANTNTEARILLGWGMKDYNKLGVNNGSYMLLAQAAINHYDNYLESMFYNLIANSYTEGSQERLEAYHKSLEKLNINLDTYDGLINEYSAVGKTDEEWMALAYRIVDAYTYYPLAMVEALNRIDANLTNNISKSEITILKTEALNKATKATTANTLQPEVSKIVANSLLSGDSIDLATFSFTGENANSIVLNEYYDNVNQMVKYSLDGGLTWTQNTNHTIKLTQEELDSLNADKDIIVGLVGMNATYTIDLKAGKTISSTDIYLNDSENLLIGATDNLEYSLDNGKTWNDYISGLDSDVRFTGNQSVIARYKAYDQYLPGESKTFNFTENTINPTSAYLQLRHVNLYEFSSEQGSKNAAAQFIDGNYNTRWHTTWDWVDDAKYISVQFDKVRYISKLTYLPHDTSGRLRSGNIYTSMDGVNWEKVHSFSNLPNTMALKTIDLGNSYEAKYVKIESTESYGRYENQTNVYFAGRMLDFYEDTTKSYHPAATIEYSTKELTNGDVVAKLVLPNGCTAEETEFTFSSNNTHDFIYRDANGDEHTVTAEVNWIDKILPSMTYEFDNSNPTNKDVTLTITGFNKEGVNVTILDENNNLNNEISTISDTALETVDDELSSSPSTYTFTENKTVIFQLTDRAGNVSQVPITVDWIDRVAPNATLKYSTTSLTNENVTVTLENFTEDGVVVKNNDGNSSYTFEKNGEFTFEIEDKAGNKNSITATVNWIDKEAPNVNVSYNTTDWTNQDVVATLEGLEDGDTIISEGGATHTFKENGSFEFIVRDEAGNETRVPVTVNWIDKEAPTVDISYDINSWTNHNVRATITNPSEAITVLKPSDGSDSYVFDDNGEFTFEFIDKAGNIGTATANVHWIDKEAPTATLKYSTTKPTNGEVTVTLENISEEVTIKTEDGKTSHTFTDNGTYDFVLVDKAGNETVITAEVNWIKKEGPKVQVEYDVTELTNGSVTATLTGLVEGDKVIGNCGDTHYTFTNNGSYTFVVEDEAGNRVEVEATVDWIDKEAPTADIVYSTTELTNRDVTASLENFSEEGVTIKNNNGQTTYTFTENGEFEFILVDKAGNETKLVAKVENIDKTPPFVMLNYSTTELTNSDVTVTVEGLQEDEEIVNHYSNSYTFTKNGEFEFIVRDRAGNETKALAVVDWIDKEAPTADIVYSKTELTNRDVTVSLENFSEEGVTIKNNDGQATYTFTENGEFVFILVDKAGNETNITTKVDWIDKEAPTATISYNHEDKTNQNVIATLNTQEENITILNNNGKASYEFTENGEFTFIISDQAGNITEVKAEVTWINKETPVLDVVYSTEKETDQPVTATLITEGLKIKRVNGKVITVTNNNGNKEYTFTENGEFTFEYVDDYGNTGTTTAKVDWIVKTPDTPSYIIPEPIKPLIDLSIVSITEGKGTKNEPLVLNILDSTEVTALKSMFELFDGYVLTIERIENRTRQATVTYLMTLKNSQEEYHFTVTAVESQNEIIDYLDSLIEDKAPDNSGNTMPDNSENTTPDNGGNTTPDNSENITPDNGGNTTPDNSGNPTPDNGGNTTPDNSGNPTPDNGGNTTPDNNGNTTPDNNGNTTPDNSGNTTPDNGGNTTPDNSGNTTPDNGGNTTPDNNENGIVDNNVDQESKPQTGMNTSLPFMLGGMIATLSGITSIYKKRRK